MIRIKNWHKMNSPKAAARVTPVLASNPGPVIWDQGGE